MTFPNRPDHPDFWLLSQAVTAIDAQSDSGASVREVVTPYVDPESLEYAAKQRALRAAGPDTSARTRGAYAALWMDGFMAGVRYQHLKTSDAPESNDDK